MKWSSLALEFEKNFIRYWWFVLSTSIIQIEDHLSLLCHCVSTPPSFQFHLCTILFPEQSILITDRFFIAIVLIEVIRFRRRQAIWYSAIKKRRSSLRLDHQDDHQPSQRPSQDEYNSPPAHSKTLFFLSLDPFATDSSTSADDLSSNTLATHWEHWSVLPVFSTGSSSFGNQECRFQHPGRSSNLHNRFRPMCFERDCSHLTPQIRSPHHPFEWERRWFESSLSLSRRAIEQKHFPLRLWMNTPDHQRAWRLIVDWSEDQRSPPMKRIVESEIDCIQLIYSSKQRRNLSHKQKRFQINFHQSSRGSQTGEDFTLK